VAPAVEAFYHRDVDSMKAAAKMAYVLPQGPHTPLVKSSVQFSRAMFAQVREKTVQLFVSKVVLLEGLPYAKCRRLKFVYLRKVVFVHVVVRSESANLAVWNLQMRACLHI
jgi:hypothetical protein